MIIKIPHKQPVDEVKQNIEKLLENLKIKYGSEFSNLKEYWKENTLIFSLVTKGYTISGTVKAHKEIIEVEFNLPFIAGLFKRKIKNVIETNIKQGLF